MRQFLQIFLLLLIAGSAQAKDFTHDLSVTTKSGLRLSVMGKPTLQDKRLSQVKVLITGAESAEVLSFDAEMPSHNHGMVVKATVPKALKKGKEYLIKGVKLHMPGDWLVKIKIKTAKGEEELKAPLLIKP